MRVTGDIARPQQVLVHREIGIPLARIAPLLDDPDADPLAHLAAELGVLAFKRGYARWSENPDDDTGLAPHALAALAELRDATTSLG